MLNYKLFKNSLNSKRLFSNCTRLNSLYKSILKNEFYKFVKNIDNSSSKKNILQKDIIDNIDAKKSTEHDLARIGPAQKAIEKISNNETPSKSEFTAYSYLKTEYEEHLEDDSDSDSDSGLYKSPKQTPHEKLNNLKSYLKGEYKINVTNLKKLKKKLPVIEEEKTKRKLDDLDDQSISKKSQLSVHDYIDNIPKDYNPFDDIGTD